MKKYLATIQFRWNEETMALIAKHRSYINTLIAERVIEQYAVSMEVQTIWIMLNAKSKSEVHKVLSKSPFYPYWMLEVNELMVWDGQNYRLPVLQYN